MKIALITPPTIGNQVRGTGVYIRRLTSELYKFPHIQFTQAPFNFWKWDYSEFDLVHFLYFDPFFLTLSPLRNKKTIVSVMDLTTIVLKNLYPRGIRGEIKWQVQKLLLSKANGIITISNSAKNDISQIIDYPKNDITVTYLAPSESTSDVSKTQQDKVKKKFNLPKLFALYVGDVNPNKNLIKLVEAMALVKDMDLKLVLVGKSLTQNIPESLAIKEKISSLGLQERILMTGFAQDEDLVAIYSLATLFVHPAIYEGFGLGVLQALSVGLPTICGDNSSLPEVAGDVAIYADVTNPSNIAEKISQVLKMSPKEKEIIKNKSLKQAKKFSWEKTAAETVAVYNTINNQK